jgi:hypothetical protein
MTLPTSPEKRKYSPFISSPLNPGSYFNEVPPEKDASRPKTPGPARKLTGSLSPTQRLLRQKAAAAWRSETLQQGPRPSLDTQFLRHNFDEKQDHSIIPEAALGDPGAMDVGRAIQLAARLLRMGEQEPLRRGDDLHAGIDISPASQAFVAEPSVFGVRRRATGMTMRRVIFAIGVLCGLGLILTVYHALARRPLAIP